MRLLLLFLTVFFAQNGHTAPTSFTSTKQEDVRVYHCERTFLYQGQKLPCDSNVEKNAEQLRPYLQDIPDAVAALNTYQSNRRSIKTAAYTVTAGLALIIIGSILYSTNTDGNGKPTLQGIAIRNATWIPGIALGAGSIMYTISILSSNEANLSRAVDLHNKKNPNKPIELQFQTGITF